MDRIRWFFHLLTRALLQRRSRTLLVTLALALAAGLATSLVGLTAGMEEKLGEELRAYGANFVIKPKTAQIGGAGIEFGQVSEEAYLSESKMERVLSRHQREIAGYSFKLEGQAQAGKGDVIVTGVYFDQLKNLGAGWRVDGNWPKNPDEVLIGTSLAEQLRSIKGSSFQIAVKGRTKNFKVVGIVETGAAEDKAILMDLKQAQSLFSLPDKISQALVSVRAYRIPLETLAEQISQQAPEAEAKTLQQAAKAEADLLDKILKLLLLVTVSVVIATGIAVVNTFSTIVLERREEIGLLKALGSTNRFIALLFLAEGGALSLSGALIGYVGGVLLAELFAYSAFSAWIALPWTLIVVALGTSLTVGILASLGPVRSALKVDPATTLRGL